MALPQRATVPPMAGTALSTGWAMTVLVSSHQSVAIAPSDWHRFHVSLVARALRPGSHWRRLMASTTQPLAVKLQAGLGSLPDLEDQRAAGLLGCARKGLGGGAGQFHDVAQRV
jgi:hypothetical protein